jgi:hypothetical protein
MQMYMYMIHTLYVDDIHVRGRGFMFKRENYGTAFFNYQKTHINILIFNINKARTLLNSVRLNIRIITILKLPSLPNTPDFLKFQLIARTEDVLFLSVASELEQIIARKQLR